MYFVILNKNLTCPALLIKAGNEVEAMRLTFESVDKEIVATFPDNVVKELVDSISGVRSSF